MRRELRVTIKAEPTYDEEGKMVAPARPGRDEGKVFVITELSAARAEEWGLRALLALSNAGAEVPDDVMGAGMAGVAAMSLQALSGLKYGDAKPLLDEMFDCVQICPDPKAPNVVRALIDDDIEEVLTRVQLRKEVLQLHVGFSLAGAPSTQASQAPAMSAGGVITRTSPAR